MVAWDRTRPCQYLRNTLIFKNIKTEFDGVLIQVGKPHAKEFGCRPRPLSYPLPHPPLPAWKTPLSSMRRCR